MSVTVSTPVQICNSPLNASKAKMLYTFNKSSKEIYVQKSHCQQAFYDLPGVRENRTAGFGYGSKYDFTKSAATNPSPNTYEIKSVFESGSKKKAGYSFGLSREAMAITGGFFVGEKKSPGPGAYDTRETGKKKLSYSFRPRTNMDNMNSLKHVPGPGTYQSVETITPKGKYFVSKFKSSGATLVSPARSKRFNELKPGNPGPGTYETPKTIEDDGSYFVSKFRSSFCRSFSHAMRKNASLENIEATPGPGTYKLPSEFGHYESSKVHTTTK